MNARREQYADEIAALKLIIKAQTYAVKMHRKVDRLLSKSPNFYEDKTMSPRSYGYAVHDGKGGKWGKSPAQNVGSLFHGGYHRDRRMLFLVYAFLRGVPYHVVEKPKFENQVLKGSSGFRYNWIRTATLARFANKLLPMDKQLTQADFDAWLDASESKVEEDAA